MLRINMEMLMLGMLGSFDRCNVRNECGNGGMLGVNVLIGAMLVVNVRSECGNRGMLGMDALISAI